MDLTAEFDPGTVNEPGITPAHEVTPSWRTFSAAGGEAGISRRYGGIHFELGDFEARAAGPRVAARVWTKVKSYIEGGTAQR
jgi:hypothetical protein